MADLSQVELNGTTYDLKDLTIRRAHGLDPIATKTYTDVIATANDNNGAGFFYLKVRADAYTTAWHVKTRVKATVPGNVNYNTDTIFDIWGHTNTYSWYACLNRIRSTSYRPIYYNSLFRLNETGYNNGCANWVGFSLVGATNNTSSSYKRQVIVELLEYDGCSVELQDSLITPTNIPERAAHTDWYTSANTSFDNFDACNYGLKQSGDANTTDISNLTFANGTYIADSAVYRNQLLFQKDENTLTPLNNNDNTTGTSKTMLTTVEFDPFGRIAYYNSTTNISAGGSLGAGALFWQRSGFDLRYTFNCGTTLTAQKPFYLVVTPTSNGLCKIASTTPWSQTLPTSNDGKWYILLGRTYSTYQMALYPYHPVYYHDGLKVKMLVEPEPSTNSVMTLDASGDIATFNHASTDVPLKSLAVDIESLQNLHGHDSPYPAGGGANKIVATVAGLKSANTSGLWSGDTYTANNVTFEVLTDDGGNITGIKVNGTASGTIVFYASNNMAGAFAQGALLRLDGITGGSSTTYKLDWQIIKQDSSSAVIVTTYSGTNNVTISEAAQNATASYIRIVVYSGTVLSNQMFYPMIKLQSDASNTFVPSSNECPINGWTGISSSRSGINLLNIDGVTGTNSGVTFTKASDGTWTTSGTAANLVAYPVGTINIKSGETYVLSGCPTGGSTNNYRLDVRATPGAIYNNWIDTGSGSSEATLTANEDATVKVYIRIASGYNATGLTFKPVVRLTTDGYINITGTNLWDEQWEVGDINSTTGQNEANSALIRSKNYIPIVGGKTYFAKVGNATGNLRARFYDSSKTYIGYADKSGAMVQCNSAFTIPDNVFYMRFAVPAGYGATYNSDIAINYPSDATSYTPYIIGENLLDQVEWTAGPIMSDGSIGTDTNFQHSPVMSVKPGETYILTYGIGRTGNRRVHGYINGTWKQRIAYKDYSATGGRDSLTFTIPSGINGLAVSLSNLDSYVRLELVDPVSVTWSDVGGTGKNLFDPTANVDKWLQTTGAIIDHSGSVVSQKIYCSSGDNFTLSLKEGTGTLAIAFYNATGRLLNRTGIGSASKLSKTAPEGTVYMYAGRFYDSSSDVQLERSTSASSYAPYYVGTVYGGKVDLASGVLTVDTAVETENGGNQYWQLNTGGVGRFYLPFLPSDLDTSRKAESICNVLTYKDDNTVYGSFFVYGGSGLYVNKISASETLEEFKTRISNPALQIIYPLAHPRTYQLTPQQIHALKGNNVIYTNCGPVKVEYYTESMIQATDSYAGLMSAKDKEKLDALSGIAISETEPTNEGVLTWIDPDASGTIGILSETEINSQYVSHDHAQTLTSAQQNRALQNIGISNGTDAQKTNLATFAGISLTVVGTI